MATRKELYNHYCGHEGKPIKNTISGYKICPVCGVYLIKGSGVYLIKGKGAIKVTQESLLIIP